MTEVKRRTVIGLKAAQSAQRCVAGSNRTEQREISLFAVFSDGGLHLAHR